MHRRTTGSQPQLQHRRCTLTQQITLHYISTAWDTTCRHKAKDITPSITWRREAWKEEALNDLPQKYERGPSSSRWTLEPFQRKCWGNFWETGWSTYGLFWVHRYHLELNSTTPFQTVGGCTGWMLKMNCQSMHLTLCSTGILPHSVLIAWLDPATQRNNLLLILRSPSAFLAFHLVLGFLLCAHTAAHLQ